MIAIVTRDGGARCGFRFLCMIEQHPLGEFKACRVPAMCRRRMIERNRVLNNLRISKSALHRETCHDQNHDVDTAPDEGKPG